MSGSKSLYKRVPALTFMFPRQLIKMVPLQLKRFEVLVRVWDYCIEYVFVSWTEQMLNITRYEMFWWLTENLCGRFVCSTDTHLFQSVVIIPVPSHFLVLAFFHRPVFIVLHYFDLTTSCILLTEVPFCSVGVKMLCSLWILSLHMF